MSVLRNREVSDIGVGRSHVQVGAALLLSLPSNFGILRVFLWRRQSNDSRFTISCPVMLLLGVCENEESVEALKNCMCVCVRHACVCVAAPMATSSPAASPAWTTAPTDSAQSTRARCCLSASKTLSAVMHSCSLQVVGNHSL